MAKWRKSVEVKRFLKGQWKGDRNMRNPQLSTSFPVGQNELPTLQITTLGV